MLNARKRTVTTNTSTTNGLLSETNPSGTPITDLIPRRYQVFGHKLHTFQSNQTNSQRRTHRIRLRATSSFWSPPPPPTLPDEEQGYQDYLPSNLSLEHNGRGGGGGDGMGVECERSLSDESETVGGTVKDPLSPISPISTDPLVVQRPPSTYDSVRTVSLVSILF